MFNAFSRLSNEPCQSGDHLIGTFENHLEMKSFIFGMALALGVLPPEVIEQIKKFVQQKY